MWALARHDDRLTAACNRVALLLAGNTPFYPLYLWFILGREGWPALLLTGLSLPVFMATIWVARRHPLAGRIWLCTAASLNTAWVTWLLGAPSGITLFFLPCLVLAVLAFRGTELLPRALLTLLPFGLYAASLWAPHAAAIYPAADYPGLVRLNAAAVASLCVILPYMLGAARGEG